MKKLLIILVTIGLYAQKVEYLGEEILTLEKLMEIELLQGNHITLWRDTSGSKIVFFDDGKNVLREVKIPSPFSGCYFSQNKKYVGIRYRKLQIASPDDRFMFFDEKGNLLWELYRKDDRGALNSSPATFVNIQVYISNNGERVVASRNPLVPSSSKNLKLCFYDAKNGNLIKKAEIPHYYYWRASFSPDGEIFVVIVPNSTSMRSKNDWVYCFDKNGNLLWRYQAKGKHFVPCDYPNWSSLCVTNELIFISHYDGLVVLRKDGELVDSNFRPFPTKKSGGFSIKSAGDGKYIVFWDAFSDDVRIGVLETKKMDILWTWKWDVKNPRGRIYNKISHCIFTKNKLIALGGKVKENKRFIFIFDINKGFLKSYDFPADEIKGKPIVIKNYIYFVNLKSKDKKLYTFKIKEE